MWIVLKNVYLRRILIFANGTFFKKITHPLPLQLGHWSPSRLQSWMVGEHSCLLRCNSRLQERLQIANCVFTQNIATPFSNLFWILLGDFSGKGYILVLCTFSNVRVPIPPGRYYSVSCCFNTQNNKAHLGQGYILHTCSLHADMAFKIYFWLEL